MIFTWNFAKQSSPDLPAYFYWVPLILVALTFYWKVYLTQRLVKQQVARSCATLLLVYVVSNAKLKEAEQQILSIENTVAHTALVLAMTYLVYATCSDACREPDIIPTCYEMNTPPKADICQTKCPSSDGFVESLFDESCAKAKSEMSDIAPTISKYLPRATNIDVKVNRPLALMKANLRSVSVSLDDFDNATPDIPIESSTSPSLTLSNSDEPTTGSATSSYETTSTSRTSEAPYTTTMESSEYYDETTDDDNRDDNETSNTSSARHSAKHVHFKVCNNSRRHISVFQGEYTDEDIDRKTRENTNVMAAQDLKLWAPYPATRKELPVLFKPGWETLRNLPPDCVWAVQEKRKVVHISSLGSKPVKSMQTLILKAVPKRAHKLFGGNVAIVL